MTKKFDDHRRSFIEMTALAYALSSSESSLIELLCDKAAVREQRVIGSAINTTVFAGMREPESILDQVAPKLNQLHPETKRMLQLIDQNFSVYCKNFASSGDENQPIDYRSVLSICLDICRYYAFRQYEILSNVQFTNDDLMPITGETKLAQWADKFGVELSSLPDSQLHNAVCTELVGMFADMLSSVAVNTSAYLSFQSSANPAICGSGAFAGSLAGAAFALPRCFSMAWQIKQESSSEPLSSAQLKSLQMRTDKVQRTLSKSLMELVPSMLTLVSQVIADHEK